MEEPREISLEMLQCSEEVLESFEELQYKVEELQIFCESCAKKNEELKKVQIDKEREYNQRIQKLTEEMKILRDTKMHILRENIMKECAITPRWFNALTKSVNQEKIIKELTEKLDESRIELMEKDKTISSLQWQLKNSSATITVLNADRTRLASEADTMALRMEELEYANNFRPRDYGLNHPESASLYSYEDEAMSYSDKPSQLHSRNSYADSDEGSSGLGTLKRAANFSDINKLDESADFQLASSTILSDPFAEASMNTTTSLIASPEFNRNGDCNDNFCANKGDKLCKTQVTGDGSDDSDATNDSKTIWEAFGSSKNVNKLETKDTFKPPDSLPNRVVNDIENSDPWVSPCTSPLALPKSRASQNQFWESNSSVQKLPFYIPKDNEDKDIKTKENSIAPVDDLNSVPSSESFKPGTECSDTKLINAALKLPRDNMFLDRKKSSSWNSDNRERKAKIFPRISSKDDLWDFEPDSIVDVSTGETIYESMGQHDILATETLTGTITTDPKATEGMATKPLRKKLSCDKNNLSSHEVGKESVPIINIETERSKDSISRGTKPKLKQNGVQNSGEDSPESEDRKIEFIRKGSKKEKEAFNAFVNWKTQGKQGSPPANLKVSQC